MHIVDKCPLYFLHSKVIRKVSSISVSSSFSLELLSRRDREKDGGFILKDERGRTLLRIEAKDLRARTNLALCAQQLASGEFNIATRKIDGVVARRVVEYMEQYYDKYCTNCSTLVEYLRTGIFTECDSEGRHQLFSAGVNLFTTQKIEPGDSLCVLYYRKEVMRRHKHLREIRKHCRRNKKLSDLTRLNEKFLSRTLSPEEITNLCQSMVYGDYHFLFCIGVDNGEPILIHQLGFNEPGVREQETPAIVVSVGMTNFYPTSFTPAHLFIKKGRRKR